MRQNAQPLPIIYSNIALVELDEIATWNVTRYGSDHARRYMDFLDSHIDAIASNYIKGKVVKSRPEYRYILIQRRRKGHGHVVVYSYDSRAVYILHVFHSAQDWQGIVARE